MSRGECRSLSPLGTGGTENSLERKWAVLKAELGDAYTKQDSGLQKAAHAGFCRARFGYRHTSQLPKEYMEREGLQAALIHQGGKWSYPLSCSTYTSLHFCSLLYPMYPAFHEPPPPSWLCERITQTGKVWLRGKRQMSWDPHPGEKSSTFLYFYVISYCFTPALHGFVSY